MINSQSQPITLNQSAIPISEPTAEEMRNKVIYGNQLRQQIQEKKQRQQQEKYEQRLQDLQLQSNIGFNKRGGGGAPNRDYFGNITTTRRNPLDPNAQSIQWFGPTGQSNQTENLSLSQYPSSQLQQPRLISSNQSMINLPTNQNIMGQSQVSLISDQIAREEKRRNQTMLQRELQQQMELAEMKKKEEKFGVLLIKILLNYN